MNKTCHATNYDTEHWKKLTLSEFPIFPTGIEAVEVVLFARYKLSVQ